MDAEARVVVDTAPGGRLRVRELRTPAPLGVRLAQGELHLLGTAAGPMGGDRLRLEVVVGRGTSVTVRSVAAAVAQRGNGTPSTHHVVVTVEDGAHLDWSPQPLIAAAGCDHRSTATVTLGVGASVRWRDELVLGRSGERPGRCASALRVVRGGVPVIHHEVSTATTGWDGPAVTAGAAAVGQLTVVGGGEVRGTATAGRHAAWLRLGPDVGLGVALADDHPTLERHLRTIADAAHVAVAPAERSVPSATGGPAGA